MLRTKNKAADSRESRYGAGTWVMFKPEKDDNGSGAAASDSDMSGECGP